MFRMRSIPLAILLSAAISLASPHHFSNDVAPLYIPDVSPSKVVPNSYIVMFKDDVKTDSIDSHVELVKVVNGASPLHGAESGLKHVWNSDVAKGYSGTFSENVIEMIRRQPEVAYIELEQVVYAHEIQKQAPWGLARISQHEKVFLFGNYEYVENGGEGVMAYVLDTGVLVNHTDFEGRARWGTTIPKDVDWDRSGHGTHVAGTIASKTYGVAKHANITAVKVLYTETQGALGDVITGIIWAVNDTARLKDAATAELQATGKTSYKGSVINLSLGTPRVSLALNNATEKAVQAGVHVVVSAGNEHHDACQNSPASAPSPLTVGASSTNDEQFFISNYGKCVDVFAPGEEIKSTSRNGGAEERDGTSMAAPHVAGLIAYFLSIYPHETFNPVFESRVAHAPGLVHAYTVAYNALPEWVSRSLPSPLLFKTNRLEGGLSKTLTPAEMKKAIIDLSTKNALSSVEEGTPNLLVFNNATKSKNEWMNRWPDMKAVF